MWCGPASIARVSPFDSRGTSRQPTIRPPCPCFGSRSLPHCVLASTPSVRCPFGSHRHGNGRRSRRFFRRLEGRHGGEPGRWSLLARCG
eukprot:scaffold436_cov336-Pavlova_lutheri.AAC.36